MKMWFWMALCASLAGCTINLGNDDDDDGRFTFNGSSGSGAVPSEATLALEQLRECEPERAAFMRAHRVYEETRASVHELITCGQMQVSTAAKMRFLIIASNEEQFDEETFAELYEQAAAFGIDLDVGFEQDAEGTWRMGIDGAGDGSTFDLRFYDPDSGGVLLDDVFDLDNYLLGVDGDNELSLEEMLADPFRQNTFTYSFEEPGPLAHLMNGGDPIPNPFEVKLALVDIGLAGTGWSFDSDTPADFGPFESILDVEMDSEVSVDDPRGDVTVTYRVRATRDSAASVARGSILDFEVESIEAGDGTYRIETDAAEISFVGQRNLAGTIDYRLTGPELDVRVTSDFGSGASYPEPVWRCRD